MSPSRIPDRVIPSLTVLVTLLLLPACQTAVTGEGYRRAEAGENTTTISLPGGVSREAARRAVLYGLARHGWTIEEGAGGALGGKLDYGGIRAELEFELSAEEIRIVSRSRDEDGVPYVPVRWINSLAEDIRERLTGSVAAD